MREVRREAKRKAALSERLTAQSEGKCGTNIVLADEAEDGGKEM